MNIQIGDILSDTRHEVVVQEEMNNVFESTC